MPRFKIKRISLWGNSSGTSQPKIQLDTNTFDSIHWKSHEAAINRFSTLQRITVFKLIHGWLATRKNRTRAGKAHSPLCALCMGVEDNHHIYVCPEVCMAHKRVEEFNKLGRTLCSSIDTDPFKAIMAGMWSLTIALKHQLFTEQSSALHTEPRQPCGNRNQLDGIIFYSVGYWANGS